VAIVGILNGECKGDDEKFDEMKRRDVRSRVRSISNRFNPMARGKGRVAGISRRGEEKRQVAGAWGEMSSRAEGLA
jgi:hypothetical protein